MKPRVFFFIAFIVLLIVSDFYTLKALELVFPSSLGRNSRFRVFYWVFKVLLWVLFILTYFLNVPSLLRRSITIFFFSLYAGGVVVTILSMGDDIRRGLQSLWFWFTGKYPNPNPETKSSPLIPRSEFITKTGLGLGSLAFLGISGINSSSLYDYRVRKVHLHLPNLPSAFEGMSLVQISDIHSGSFFDLKAVNKGVELALELKPEIILFTGDLVNAKSEEMKDYQRIFAKLHAPLGVYSVLGNHDYGDYAQWNTFEQRYQDHLELIKIHKLMGYDLLMNENRTIKIGNEEISLLGVENWSASSDYPKHGRLDLAIKGTENSPVRLLMSHDPSHWRAQILPHYPTIDATFSGHTHGMQMGIRMPHFQWSPIQYIYPEWAGLYQSGQQKLYVNVGFGFIGYPGRLGIYPEITQFTLSAKNA